MKVKFYQQQPNKQSPDVIFWMIVKIRNRKFYVIYDSSYIYPNLNKSYTEIVYKILYLSFYSKIMRSRTKGEISNTEKFNKEISRVKFSASTFQGRRSLSRAQAKWRERSEAQGCPYKRCHGKHLSRSS